MKDIVKVLVMFFVLMVVVFRLGLWNAGKVGITEDQYWGFLWLQFKWIWGTAGALILAWGVICFGIAGVDEIRKRRRERREEAAEDLELRQQLEAGGHYVAPQKFDFADNREFLSKQPPKAADSDIEEDGYPFW